LQPAVALLKKSPPNNWEALKEYTAAMDSWRSRPSDHDWPPDQREIAEDHLRRALEIDPQFARAAAGLADIQVSSREYDEGMLNYERAASLIDVRNLTDRESLSIRGMFALDSGQYEKAQQIFARFAEEYPDTGLPFFHEARAVECQGNLEGSLHLLGLALKKDPDNYTYTIDRAIRFLMLGRFAEAQRDCDRAAQKNPSDWVDQTRAGLAFARGDLRGVWDALEHMKSNGSVSYRGKAFALEACLRAEQNRPQDAQRLFEEGLRYDRAANVPPVASLLKQELLAWLLVNCGTNAKAIEVCQAILETNPGVRPALEVGAILAQAGDLKAARACLPKGVSVTPPTSVPRSFGPDAASQLIEWPVYFRRILHLWAEMALAEGDPKTAFRLMAAAPPPEAVQEWPDILIRASIASGERATAENKLTALFRNPAMYWFGPDRSPPGFMRKAIGQARQLNMIATLWSPLEKLLNQTTE
jgi:tetratricopeptide (TPR) repeat protein